MRTAGLVLALCALAAGGSLADEASVSVPVGSWGGGTWSGHGTRVEAAPDLLTVRYRVGETADDWPNAQLQVPGGLNLSGPAKLAFEMRVTTQPAAAKLPPRFLSILMGTTGGARWQQDMLPTPVTPGQWVAEEVSLLRLPGGFLESLGLVELFVWNRDYHAAGLGAGTEVTFEVRNVRLLGTRPESAPSVFGRPGLARVLGHAAGLVAWSEPADTKVLPEQKAPAGEPGPVEVSAAGNEGADFQVALRAERDLGPLSVELTEPRLVGQSEPALGFQTRVRLEGYIRTERPSGYLIRAGLCPDPLLEEGAVTLKAGETRALWVNVQVPEGAAAGVYEGQVWVLDGDQAVIVAPYRVRVRGYSLPHTPALRTAFQLSVEQGWSHMMDHYPNAGYDMVKTLWTSMARHRIAPMHLGPSGPPQGDDPAALEAFEKYVDLAEELGFNSYGPFMWGPQVETEEQRQWVRRMVDWYQSKGLLDRLYVYMCQYDEAQPDRYQALKDYATALKAADPRVQRFITVAPHPDLYGAIDWWCPGTPAYNLEVARQRRAQGEKVWWYTCVTWTPGLLMDAPGAEHRALLWLTFTQEADGLLFWCIDYWPQNPWDTPVMGSGTAGNGDGYLIYPRREGDPADRFYETVRLEVLRESLEDYDALAILQARLKAAHAAGSAAPEAVAAGQAALAAAGQIAANATTYSLDAADYAYVRGLVDDAIEALGVR